MCSTHTMEYYSDMKRNRGLTHATAWTNPENMLSDRSQTQTAIILITGSIKHTNFHRDKEIWVGKSYVKGTWE